MPVPSQARDPSGRPRKRKFVELRRLTEVSSDPPAVSFMRGLRQEIVALGTEKIEQEDHKSAALPPPDGSWIMTERSPSMPDAAQFGVEMGATVRERRDR